MKFTYLVRAEIDRFNVQKIEASYADEYCKEFSDENALNARNEAWNYAMSFEDILSDADSLAKENFFQEQNGKCNEYNISIFFVNPLSGEELKIHDTRSIRDNMTLLKGKAMYDPFETRWILKALNQEFEALKSKSVSVDSAIEVEVTFLPKEERESFWIFPTTILNERRIIVQDIEL